MLSNMAIVAIVNTIAVGFCIVLTVCLVACVVWQETRPLSTPDFKAINGKIRTVMVI